MDFVRKVANSDILTGIFDLPESLKNKKVEILIMPYESQVREDSNVSEFNGVRGALEKYKNNKLIKEENEAWTKAVADD